MSQEPHGQGKFLKNCKGCKKPFRTDGRNAQFGPPEMCNCLARRAKNRQKRAKERRIYHKDPEKFKALSRTRAEARKLVLAHHGIVVKNGVPQMTVGHHSLGCNSPGCTVNFHTELQIETARRDAAGIGFRGAGLAAMKKLLRKLEAHHRDHNPFNNRFESYPEGSNIELLCRKHHEQADRAKAGKAQIVLWEPPKQTWFEYLVEVYGTDRRRFWLTPVPTLLAEWEKATT